MKTFLINISFLAVIVFCASCESTPQKHYCTVVAVDKTGSGVDYSQNRITAQVLTSLSSNQNANSAQSIWISEIKDVSMNAVYSFYLSPCSSLGNPHNRKDSITSFYKNVDRHLAQVFNLPTPMSRSSIYLSLCHLLKGVANLNADEKRIYIWSDMLENSNLTLSFYSSVPSENNYHSIVETLEDRSKFPNLSGMHITIIYPPNIQSDKYFFYAKNFWLQFLTENGASSVKFVANF